MRTRKKNLEITDAHETVKPTVARDQSIEGHKLPKNDKDILHDADQIKLLPEDDDNVVNIKQ